MSYSQVGTLRLTELRYQVGKGRVGGTLYPSFFIWTHKLFSAFLKRLFMVLCMCGKLKDRLKHITTWRWYLSSWFIIFLDLSLLQFFSIGRPPLWDGLLTRISLNSLRTSLLSGGKWFSVSLISVWVTAPVSCQFSEEQFVQKRSFPISLAEDPPHFMN